MIVAIWSLKCDSPVLWFLYVEYTAKDVCLFFVARNGVAILSRHRIYGELLSKSFTSKHRVEPFPETFTDVHLGPQYLAVRLSLTVRSESNIEDS